MQLNNHPKSRMLNLKSLKQRHKRTKLSLEGKQSKSFDSSTHPKRVQTPPHHQVKDAPVSHLCNILLKMPTLFNVNGPYAIYQRFVYYFECNRIRSFAKENHTYIVIRDWSLQCQQKNKDATSFIYLPFN